MRRHMKFSEWVGVAVVAALIAWAAVAMLGSWLDAGLDKAFHERRDAEERIDLLEQVIAARIASEAVAMPEPTVAHTEGATTATPDPMPPPEPLLRESDIWPELAYDGVLDSGCWAILARRYPPNEYQHLHRISKRPFRDLGNELATLLERVRAIVTDGGAACMESKDQIHKFLQLRNGSRHRWRQDLWIPYPGARPL